MKILNWYVTRGFLLAFSMAIAILTFGMTGANLIKVFDLVSQGISFWTFLKFTGYILPIVLTFTVPWAVMVAVMLVFGRMSADSEITAMRACGISIMQIVSPILIFTFLLTVLCLYLQVEVGPPFLGKSRELMKTAAIDQPLALFEPGKGNKLSVSIKTSVDGSTPRWQRLFDRIAATGSLPSGKLVIHDFGATPGVARLRIEQVFEEASHD